MNLRTKQLTCALYSGRPTDRLVRDEADRTEEDLRTARLRRKSEDGQYWLPVAAAGGMQDMWIHNVRYIRLEGPSYRARICTRQSETLRTVVTCDLQPAAADKLFFALVPYLLDTAYKKQ